MLKQQTKPSNNKERKRLKVSRVTLEYFSRALDKEKRQTTKKLLRQLASFIHMQSPSKKSEGEGRYQSQTETGSC